MEKIVLTEEQWSTVRRALELAGEEYAKDAEANYKIGLRRIGKQFDRQGDEARSLAKFLDEKGVD